MVSSPLHVTVSLQERLVKTTGASAEYSRAYVDFPKNDNAIGLDHSNPAGAGFFDAHPSDDDAISNHSSVSDLSFRMPPREALRKEASDSSSGSSKSVVFGDIRTRSYNVVMGDHPCCSMGCPLSLGWDYSQDPNISVDAYEATRCPRRSRENLRTTWDERRNMLSDITDGEVKRAERKLHRERSCQRKVRTRVCAAFFQHQENDAPVTNEAATSCT